VLALSEEFSTSLHLYVRDKDLELWRAAQGRDPEP
jgi:hypothetical protein